MLGDLVTRSLVLVLGYAYPALECFKTVEKSTVGMEELRFWCQYWIIVALLTILERIGDVFVSWVPMYGEMKLALFIYLWYPNTKGTGLIYEALLRPFVSNHETDMERSLKEMRAWAWDLAIYYWQNCTELGQTKFFEVIQNLISKPPTFTYPSSEASDSQNSEGRPPQLPRTPSAFFRLSNRNNQQPERRLAPSAPPYPGGRNRDISEPPKPETAQLHLDAQTHADEMHIPGDESNGKSKSGGDHRHSFRPRFRRSK